MHSYHKISDKLLDEFIAISKDKGIEYKNREEANDSAQRLVSFVEILHEGAMEKMEWDKRLEQEPKGFAIPSNGRTCSLCRRNVQGEVWWDKWGMKCLDCQDALNKKVIPGYVFKDKDNNKHVTASQLNWKFGLHNQTIRKLVRSGELQARVIKSKSHGETLVFLRSENPDLPRIIEAYIKK